MPEEGAASSALVLVEEEGAALVLVEEEGGALALIPEEGGGALVLVPEEAAAQPVTALVVHEGADEAASSSTALVPLEDE